MPKSIRLKIFIVCSGLGNITRGFESFFRDCFDAIRNENELEITLYKGRGEKSSNEIPLWNLPRNTRRAEVLGKLMGRSAYFAEQFTFFVILLPHILIKKPEVIYLSDVSLGNLLRLYKKYFGASFNVLYNNAGPTRPDFLMRWEHIQQVTPLQFRLAIQTGFPKGKQTLLPYALNVSKNFVPVSCFERDDVRRNLGLPTNKQIILSVGALNNSRKRMSYLIKEVERLPKPHPFLLLLGQKENETEDIVNLGISLLSRDNFSVRTVSKDDVKNYYKVVDIFTLASLDEGFGLVYVEAMSYGLPCLVHDYEITRFVMGEKGYYSDLTREGNLTELLNQILQKDSDLEKAYDRHAYVYKRFSWDKLKPKYIKLFKNCAG